MLTGISSLNSKLTPKLAFYALITIFVLCISLIIYSPFIPKNIHLNIGDTALSTITSPQIIEFESTSDKLINQKQLEQVKNRTGKIYTISESVNSEIIQNIQLTFEELMGKDINSLSISTLEILSESNIQKLFYLKNNELLNLSTVSLEITNKILYDGIKDVNKKVLQIVIVNNLYKSSIDETYFSAIESIILHFLKPNLLYNKEQTQLALNQAISEIDLQKTIYKLGQPIIYESEIVSSDHIEVFKQLNMYKAPLNISLFFGVMLFVILCVILLERFIFQFSVKVYSNKFFALIFLVMILLVLAGRFSVSLTILPDFTLTYLVIPMSISAMLLSCLVSPNVSLMTGTLTSVLISFMQSSPFESFLFLFFNNCLTAFIIYRTDKRSHLIFSGYMVGLFNAVFVIALGLFSDITNIMWFITNLLFAFGNGVISAMIALAILPYFESLFKITTNQTLLELSNLNHPLLKRLMMNAPGTYQHSLMVANLSEAAAEAIKANPILCRVCSYFHDIGKLKRPVFFTENQLTEDSPHTNLSPRISKMIILSHVKDGYEMGVKYKLPSIILDCILEHHGTSLLSVFYSKALAKEGEEVSHDDEFRYPGPKPQTKESGIIMLADSTEAAIRSLEKPTPQKIENMINKIFKEKIDHNQLEECPLSFNEIYLIQSTFLNLFKGIHHNRVDYQSEIDHIIEKTNTDTPSKEGHSK